MRSEKKKQAPWQSARCFEACFALILTHFALKMLKTHLCPGRQKCVTTCLSTPKRYGNKQSTPERYIFGHFDKPEVVHQSFCFRKDPYYRLIVEPVLRQEYIL